jgi:hypothetical protein
MSQVTNTAPWHNTGHSITSDRKGFQIPQELNFEIEARPVIDSTLRVLEKKMCRSEKISLQSFGGYHIKN